MESEPESAEGSQLSEDTVKLPNSYAFTVHFDNGKQGCSGEMPNKFSRRHIRNLSLPISKIYESKVNSESALNGRLTKRAGNHSEGYFSSDPDDDSKPKLFEVKHKNCDIKAGFKSTNVAQEKRSSVLVKEKENDKEEEASSDVASEAGTYTIDKDSPEVVNARQSIDSVFNVQSQVAESKANKAESVHSSSTWVNEWASAVVEHNHHSSLESTSSSSRNSGINLSGTKIPSPVNYRSRLPPMTQPLRGDHEPLRGPHSRKSYPVAAQELCTMETESYLRATERVVSAIAARVSLSLDSGGESDAENSLGAAAEPQGHTDSSASDSGNTMRYNRAFSLRRNLSSRLEEPKKKTASPALANKSKVEPAKAIAARVVKRDPPPSASPNFSRTDCGRFSMRSPRPLPQSPLMSNTKKDVVKKKVGGGGNARSNSTLSSKEVEFQNWKRRKSYDPMKAAAEGKKKDVAKKAPPLAMTQSINSTLNTPKSPVNPVLRSASFHGTQHLTTASSSEEEEEEEVALSPEEDDWPVLQAPRTSLENIPQTTRVSVNNHTSNSPTPPLRNRPKLEEMKKPVVVRITDGANEKGVDTLVISALATLSGKLKGNACHLLKKLRFLYDDDSPKNHQLRAMIDQLEASEPGSPQVKSPSRELATTLRNLKRFESMLKVLDEVLFDEEEFQ